MEQKVLLLSMKLFLFLIRKAAEAAKIVEVFKKTLLGKRAEKINIRENLSDFDRFKVMVLKRRVSFNII